MRENGYSGQAAQSVIAEVERAVVGKQDTLIKIMTAI